MLRMFRQLEAKRQNDESGFTLIELLVVIIIIGILAAIAIPVFLNQRERAWRSAVQSDLRNVAIQAATYLTDSAAGSYVDFEQDDLFQDYTPSPGVTLTAYSGDQDAEGFCVEGFHANSPDETDFRYDSRESPQLDRGTCDGDGTAVTVGS